MTSGRVQKIVNIFTIHAYELYRIVTYTVNTTIPIYSL